MNEYCGVAYVCGLDVPYFYYFAFTSSIIIYACTICFVCLLIQFEFLCRPLCIAWCVYLLNGFTLTRWWSFAKYEMGWKEMEYVKLRFQIIMQLHKRYVLLAVANLSFFHYCFAVVLLSYWLRYTGTNTSGCGKMYRFRNSCSSFSRNLKKNVVETI